MAFMLFATISSAVNSDAADPTPVVNYWTYTTVSAVKNCSGYLSRVTNKSSG